MAADDAPVATEPAAEKQPPAAEEQPQAPAAPQMSLSQIVPLVCSLAMSNYNLQEMGYSRHVEAAYVVAQIVCIATLGYIYMKIQAMSDEGEKLRIPEVKQMGQVVAPATEQTPKEYDMTKVKSQGQQIGIGAIILGGVYYKWGYLFPLVLQIVTTPLQLVESPLFRIHVLGRDVARPFPEPNPLGLPMPPAPPQDDAAVADAANDGDAAPAEAEKSADAKKDE